MIVVLIIMVVVVVFVVRDLIVLRMECQGDDLGGSDDIS